MMCIIRTYSEECIHGENNPSLDDALAHHERRWHRKAHWERHVRGQRSLTDFVKRIRSLKCKEEKDKPMALAYGSWGGVAGKPGMACNKGNPPCLGRGLRSKLANHFLILCTPEHYTSKTCSLCGGQCGRCEEIDELRRSERAQKASNEEERRKALRYSVRGLRHCNNESCAAFVNRDHNAAVNIQRRCAHMLASGDTSLPISSEEKDMESLRMLVEFGS